MVLLPLGLELIRLLSCCFLVLVGMERLGLWRLSINHFQTIYLFVVWQRFRKEVGLDPTTDISTRTAISPAYFWSKVVSF